MEFGMNSNLTAWFIQTLTGDINSVIDWRCIHDKDKAKPAHNFRGTLAEILPTLQEYNNKGYGVFCCINAMDGNGRELANVAYARAHFVDLDNKLTAQINYERATAAGACFAVQSSPEKFHIYWRVHPYTGNDFFSTIQKKLAQLYDGDRTIFDATRVMRVPGFVHQKGEPYQVTAWPLPSIDRVLTFEQIQNELQHVNIIEHFSTRSPLGTIDMAAPSLEWLQFALNLIDPNNLDRGEWLSLSAAIKQAGWRYTTPEELFKIWSDWCARYKQDDPGENLKLWESIKDTEVGWTSIERRAPEVKAYLMFGHKKAPSVTITNTEGVNITGHESILATNQNMIPPQSQQYGEILNENECKQWFKDCYFVERTGQIFSRTARFMNSTQFNGRYGGKHFIITSTGKITDEAWKAALRSTVWTIPKVDHVRFLPQIEPFKIVPDRMGRLGLNTYIPAIVEAVEGDVTPWLKHVEKILPHEKDRKLFFDYLAHCVKFPGFKIPWAPLLQSAEGIGKTVFFEVMQHALGDMYVYSPKAPELVKSGSTFNAWQRGKLLIVVNEIKIDERRELIEILKPMITDDRVEIQSKGVDQEMEDNPANWLFFSNYKDAIPINVNGRRYAIFYSALQNKADILNAGMDDQYFVELWDWLREKNGLKYIAHWLFNYKIEKGKINRRAPETSSHSEALLINRSPMEVIISECVADGVPGFRGGYISTLAVIARAKAAGIRSPNTRTVQTCLENMGYVALGRAVRPHMQEDINIKTEVYGNLSSLPVAGYGAAQGYE